MAFRKVKKNDSFAQWFIDKFGQDKFNKLIDHKKNEELGLDIWGITKRSTANIWFFCENKDYHNYCISADKYHIGCRCKFCARTKYVHPKDSLGQYIIDNFDEEFLKKIWSNKNKKSPFKFSTGTEVKAWFSCTEGIHEDKLRQINNAVRNDFECTYCNEIKRNSNLQIKVYNYLCSLGYTVNTENNCSIIPKNPKTGLNLPFDNEVEELGLIVEVHGFQHYEKITYSRWLKDKTPEEYLHDRQLKDRYKKLIAIKNGYNYLEIPYLSDDKEGTWKHLINNNINNIKEGTTTETNRPHF